MTLRASLSGAVPVKWYPSNHLQFPEAFQGMVTAMLLIRQRNIIKNTQLVKRPKAATVPSAAVALSRVWQQVTLPLLSAIFEFIGRDAFYLPKPAAGQTETAGNCRLNVEVMLSDRCVQPQSDSRATKDTLLHQSINALAELCTFLPNMHNYSTPGRPAMLPPPMEEEDEDTDVEETEEAPVEEEEEQKGAGKKKKQKKKKIGKREAAKLEKAKLETAKKAKLDRKDARMKEAVKPETLLATAAPPANSPVIDQTLCVGLSSTTTLRKYQLRCVKWMTHQEAPAESASDALALHPGWREFTLPHDNLKLYQHITVPTAWTFRRFSEQVLNSGGILGDEVCWHSVLNSADWSTVR